MDKVNVVKMYRTLNIAQQQRMDAHKATVVEMPDGSLKVTTENIITPTGKEKENNLVSIVPSASEKIVSFGQSQHLFSELGHMNVMLTNACNLNCSYCYEQHNKDFGRFTVESLKKSYDWLRTINKQPKKVMQFFGGEPLIHKPLIKDFINQYHEEIASGWTGYSGTGLSICTNGLLLDDEFIDMYFSKPYTHALISLDTLDVEKDYRELTKDQMDRIISNVEKIVKYNVGARLTIRCTLSEETADSLESFIETMYSRGIKRLIVHPLVLDSRRGYIKWKDDKWDVMRNALIGAIQKYNDLTILFSEGVGKKEESNCMVGSDMIAIDASGDFSGCYFFTNQKQAAHETVLGNIFDNKVYIDRYNKFQSLYKEMFEVEEKCKTCDYQKMCYQCPAGNLDTGGRMFRPDDMCQEIVKLYNDLQADVAKKNFNRMFETRLKQLDTYGEQHTIAEIMAYMHHYLTTGERPPVKEVPIDDVPYQVLVARVWNVLGNDNVNAMETVDLYKNMCGTKGIPPKLIGTDAPFTRVFYAQLISSMLFKQKNNGFN